MKELFKRMKGVDGREPREARDGRETREGRSPATKKISSDEGGGSNGGKGDRYIIPEDRLPPNLRENRNLSKEEMKDSKYSRLDSMDGHQRPKRPHSEIEETDGLSPGRGFAQTMGKTYSNKDGSTYRLDRYNHRDYSESDSPPPAPRVSPNPNPRRNAKMADQRSKAESNEASDIYLKDVKDQRARDMTFTNALKRSYGSMKDYFDYKAEPGKAAKNAKLKEKWGREDDVRENRIKEDRAFKEMMRIQYMESKKKD